MKKYITLFLIFIICFSSASYSQRGKNGTLTVTATGVVANAYTTLIADVTSGATSISVTNNTLASNFSANLAAGDLIFIIQMQGATISDGEWWSGYGYIEQYNNCGKYEFAQVESVSGSNTINLSCGLTQNYSVSGKTQIVRVPRYNTLTINTGAELTCDAWDGSMRGVLVVEVLGNFVNNGSVNVSGKGFRGGATSPQYASPPGLTGVYASVDINAGGHKGEGIAGYGFAGTGPYCMGPPANGGGGGNSHNTGGGGGSNVSNDFTYNGKGFPDTTTSSTYIQAWDMEAANFHKNISFGGGRGGYSFSNANRDALTLGPNNTLWSGTNRTNNCGLGGWPLIANEGAYPRVFLGGGGGGGSANDAYGGAGGNGAGIVYFKVYGNLSGTGSFNANGANGVNSTSGNGITTSGADAAGGGGGGGAIILNASGTISGISALANGGTGGNQVINLYYNTIQSQAEGPGGGGGGGYIAISNGSITKTAIGGANGTTNSSGLTEFPPNGATKGGAGINNATITNFTINSSNILACQGQPATLTATLNGTVPPGTTYGWYTSEIGGTLLSNTTSLTINNPQTTTTYYFGTCPGTYRIAVTMNVSTFLPEAGNNVSFCLGNSVGLQASWGGLGGTYSWSPPAGLSSPNISNPNCNATTTTTYYVTITNTDACVGIDSVKVTVNSVTPVVSNDTTICSGSPLTLNASGGSSYHWSNNDSTPSINVNPVTSQTYLVTVNNLGCSATADIAVTVNTLPVVDLGNDTTFCQGPILTLDAGNSGSSFLWQNSSSSQTFGANSTGQYWVQVTNSFLCIKRDTINITVVPWSDATITPHLPLCANVLPVNLVAAENGGIWSGTGITSAANGTFNPSSALIGSNEIIYTIAGLCGDSDTTYITVNPVPVVFLGNDTTICNGDTITLDAGNPGAAYLWSNSTSVQTLNVFSQGNYWVQVTDGNSCINTDSLLLTVLPLADATISPVNPVCSNIASFNLTAAQNGGIWNGNGITDTTLGTFSPVIAGSGLIAVYYTISGLCGDSDNEYIRVFPTQNADLSFTEPGCPDYSNGTILLTVSGGTLPYHYLWNTGDSISQLSGLQNGSYYVTVSDSNNCAVTKSVDLDAVIIDCIKPVVYIPNIFSPNDDEQNDVLYVRGQGISQMNLLIYDRWGEKVFESDDIAVGWDGRYRGKEMPAGVYIYHLIVTLSDDSKVNKKGNITLER